MALERFSFARDLIAGFRKAFGTNTGFIPAVTLVDSTGADASAATAANQATIIGHVDGIETALTAANASLDAIEAFADGAGVKGSATFTPAAASHVAGDCNGAAADFTLAAPSGCVFLITDARMSIAGATAEATAWRLYLYTATPPSAIADDGQFDFTVATDGATFLGYIDLGTAADLGGGQWAEVSGINKGMKLSGTTVFGYLVNLTTLTPAAVAHTVTLIGTPL